MSDERKASWGWVVTLLIGLPVLYVASFGPACWLCEKQFAPTHITWIAFRPLTYLAVESPHAVGAPIRRYAAIFSIRKHIGLRRGRIPCGLVYLNRPFY